MRKGGKFMMEVEDHMTEDKNVIVKLYFSGEFFFFLFFSFRLYMETARSEIEKEHFLRSQQRKKLAKSYF